jgi:AraC-like DNA-binding protein
MPSVIGESESFYVNRKKLPYFGGHWHYHEEFELMYTIKGGGIRIVGDNMDHFHENELVFIGSNVPHLFKDDYKDDEASTDSIVLKFNNLFKGQNLFTLPEFQNIANFLKTAGRGIIFSKKTVKKVKKILIQLSKSEGAERFVHLFAVLNILANEENFQYLASEHFTLKTTNKGDDRTQKVIEYISENYNKDISLDDLAQVAFMTTNSFCRYFKKRTGKTVFQFLREFRINKACQMLINGEKTIAEICYDTGFNSFSSFNRIFKDLKNISASEYKSRYILINE